MSYDFTNLHKLEPLYPEYKNILWAVCTGTCRMSYGSNRWGGLIFLGLQKLQKAKQQVHWGFTFLRSKGIRLLLRSLLEFQYFACFWKWNRFLIILFLNKVSVGLWRISAIKFSSRFLLGKSPNIET